MSKVKEKTMKTKPYFYTQPKHLLRTAIGREQKQFIKIAFAVHLSAVISAERYRSDSGALKSAVLYFVFFMIIINKMQQSAKRKLLLNSPTDMPFGNRWSRYKEPSKNKAEAYRVYVEHLFLRSDAGDARIFSKEGNMTNKLSTTNIPGSQGNSYPKAELDYNLDYEYDPAYAHRLIRAGTRYYRYDANGNITAEKDGPFTDEEEFAFTYSYFENEDVYGTDYGFGLDAPKETEQANPQDLFAYRRNYTWNERNLLSKSSDRNFTVHYRYGEDGQRALKYTDEGRSETLYFNNFFTIHIPTQDQNNPQGLRVHKHIFVGNSRLVTAMTHTDNQGDNEEQKAKRYYYHSDHLGSAQFVTDWRGRQYEHIEYTPYGELWIEEVAAGLDKLPFRFTGKELDEETGLYYYGARYLDPKYSRWLSGDPALNDYIPKAPIDDEAKKHNENLPGMGGVFNVVNLHVYHYAGNNPIKYTDPDGEFAEITQEGDDITIIIPVQFKKGTTDKQKKMFTKAAEKYWTGQFGDKNVTLKVEERNKGKRNKVKFKDKKGISYVFGSKLMTLYREDTDAENEWVVGHEIGHLMKLDDEYQEAKNKDGSRKTIPKKGWAGNIMGEFWGIADERNIKDILKKNKVKDTTKKINNSKYILNVGL